MPYQSASTQTGYANSHSQTTFVARLNSGLTTATDLDRNRSLDLIVKVPSNDGFYVNSEIEENKEGSHRLVNVNPMQGRDYHVIVRAESVDASGKRILETKRFFVRAGETGTTELLMNGRPAKVVVSSRQPGNTDR
ncbi:hypothetical protein SH449x_002858 [Pirellulaceae bacterium SH449]